MLFRRSIHFGFFFGTGTGRLASSFLHAIRAFGEHFLFSISPSRLFWKLLSVVCCLWHFDISPFSYFLFSYFLLTSLQLISVDGLLDRLKKSTESNEMKWNDDPKVHGNPTRVGLLFWKGQLANVLDTPTWPVASRCREKLPFSHPLLLPYSSLVFLLVFISRLSSTTTTDLPNLC